MSRTLAEALRDALATRYPDAPQVTEPNDALLQMACRGSCRAFAQTPVPLGTLQMLAAAALAAPTKSDLQQRDVIIVQEPATRSAIANLVGEQAWVQGAPSLLVFCGNNRRQRVLHRLNDIPFANDHIDALFNAIGDAAIALGAFVTAAEAIGLGTCPISAVRNEARAISDLLNLPAHVFPFAGLAVGHPVASPEIAKRLPLKLTCHIDRYTEDDLEAQILSYDGDRAETQPYANQRFPETFGHSAAYTWSMDKARQYSKPERADFGAYLRAQNFRFD